MLSNLVYLAYAIIIVYINQVAYPYANSLYPSDDDYYGGGGDDDGNSSQAVGYALSRPGLGDAQGDYDAAQGRVYSLYLAAAIIHLVNAFMYAWTWFPAGYNWCSIVMIPEYLNMIGAALYLYTATLYPKTDGTYTDANTWQIHKAETAAAAIEVFAAMGWCYTWWLTYPRDQSGRGWTLDDPDTWANGFIFAPSIIYLVYNAQILSDPLSYCCNTLYAQGDSVYLVGAVFYVLAALRDDGYFVCLPAGGKCSYGCDARMPLDVTESSNGYDGIDKRNVSTSTTFLGFPPLSEWPCFRSRTQVAEAQAFLR